MSPEAVRQRRPTGHHIALAAVFIVAISYQVRTTDQRFPQWFGIRERVMWPFLLDAEDQPHFLLQFVHSDTYKVGLREGDSLLAIDGRAITGRSVFADILAGARPGDVIRVTVRAKGKRGSEPIRTAAVKLTRWGGTSAPLILLFVIMPVLCLALGFWVTAVRPRDVRAWLLLTLMLGFAAWFSSFPDFWEPKLRLLGTLYYSFQQNTWLAWLFIFGIYFPEPFPRASRWRRWRWPAWGLVALWAVGASGYIASSVIELHSVTAAMPVNGFLAQISIPGQVVGDCLVGGFLACIGVKYAFTHSASAKRRLRVLYAGAALGLGPLVILWSVARAKGVVFEEYFPWWLCMAAYVSFCLLPVTLAYVIVVQRAMDVRLVIRQGLQYTLARRGVLVLRILLSAALFVGVTILITSHAMKPVGTVMILAAGLSGIFLLHGAAQRVALWIDRRFFRDAYNADQILSELAEKVRTIVETQPLLETVTQRITDALHVPRMAVLLDGSGPYRPAYAIGYGSLPAVVFPKSAGTVQVLKTERQPVRVYFDDPQAWIYRLPEMSDDERARLVELRSELLLPLLVKDNLLGFMSLGQKLSEAPYSGTDIRLLNSVAAQTSLALEVSRLTTAVARETAQRERLNRELEIAREVQQHLFPQQLPHVPSLDYSGRCQPAREVGGDYYDFLELPGGKLGIAVGDVSGKGIGAALMMASLEASLRGQAPVVRDLADLMKRVNNMVFGASSANRYATFFYTEYDPASQQLSYVNAGHNPPIVLRKSDSDCQVLRLEAGGPVIGLLPNACYQHGGFALEPGDLVVLFTDGVSESMNRRDEEWGEEKLIETAKACQRLSSLETLNRILAAAVDFAGGAPQYDDMTLVVLRVGAR
jgi:phosphoserine phosphatase RsbU/P